MIGCYATGIFPRPKQLIEATRAYDRQEITKKQLSEAFDEASDEVIRAQLAAGFTYVTDGMLKWQDLLRPFTENLLGSGTGRLARWFNNNTFYRKPVIASELSRERDAVAEMACVRYLPTNVPWKAVLPAPYTFTKLSENRYYKSEADLMFAYARLLREEIEDLVKIGFRYVQLSDPSLVYQPDPTPKLKDALIQVSDALQVAIKGLPVRTCLQTYFGDFSSILPEALEFPVNDLGMDLYETNMTELKGYQLGKGVALGCVDYRSSVVEDANESASVAKQIVRLMSSSKIRDVFICPNCDLEFLPWERAQQKMKIIGAVAKQLGDELYA